MAELIVANTIHEEGEIKYTDDAALVTVASYIMRSSKTRHGYITTCNLMGTTPEEITAEMEALAKKWNNYTGVRLRHFILSYKKWEVDEPVKAYLLGDEALRFFADAYQGVMAVHEDTSHYHCHIMINSVNMHDGHKFVGYHGPHYRFLEYLRTVHREYGIKNVKYGRYNREPE